MANLANHRSDLDVRWNDEIASDVVTEDELNLLRAAFDAWLVDGPSKSDARARSPCHFVMDVNEEDAQ